MDFLGGTETAWVSAWVDALATGTAGQAAACGRLLVISGYSTQAHKYVPTLTQNDMLIMSADDKRLRGLLGGNNAPIITYGLNPRACVTASSVVAEAYQTIQCCVQRALPTFAGGVVEQQEFATTIGGAEQDVCVVLAAVTAALVMGVPVDTISSHANFYLPI